MLFNGNVYPEEEISIDEKIARGENMISQLNMILLLVPDNFSPLEKAWFVYNKAAFVFSYDFRVSSDISIAYKKIDFKKNTSGYHQTCWQISDLLCLMFAFFAGEMSANVIESNIEIRGQQLGEAPHKCVELIIGKDKYILDLTMDLFFIQSGMLPRYFASAKSNTIRYDHKMEHGDGDYTVLSKDDLIKLDKRTQLNTTGKYVDDIINRESKKFFSEYAESLNCENIISYLVELLRGKKFRGQVEGKKFIRYILNRFLSPIGLEYKEYNLINKNGVGISTVFEILKEDVYICYDKELGVYKITLDMIKKILSSGWTTASETLKEKIFGNNSNSK